MAMRWPFSRLGALALGVACVSTTTRYFLPSPQNPVYTLPQGESVLAEYVRLQCAPLRAAQKPDSGSARFALKVDSSGHTTKAELQQSTNDDMLDGIFGTVAAQLALPPASAPRRESLEVRFRCLGDSATVTFAPGQR